MKAIYPGSFDPLTNGHLDIILRASKLFDELTVVVCTSFDKQPLFSKEERVNMVVQCLESASNINVEIWDGLTVEYVKKSNSDLIVRGVRSSQDFRVEQTLANINLQLNPDIETVLLCCRPEYRDISSRTVKEIAFFGGNYSPFVPKLVKESLELKIKQKKNN